MIGKNLEFFAKLFLPIILIRFMSLEDYGYYRQLMFTYMFIGLLLPFGMRESIYYFTEYPLPVLMRWYYLFVTLVFIVMSPLILTYIHSAIDGILFHQTIILLLTAYSYALSILYDEYLMLSDKPNLFIQFNFAYQILRGASILFAVIFLTSVYDILLVLIVLHSIKIALSMKEFLFYRAEANSLSFSTFYSILRYTLPLGINKIVGSVGRKYDQIAVTLLLSPVEYGIYATGKSISPIFSTFIDIKSRVSTKRLRSEEDPNKLKELSTQVINQQISILIPVIAFLLIFMHEIFDIVYTSAFLESATIATMLLIIPLAQIFGHKYIAQAYDHNSLMLGVIVSATVINIVFSKMIIAVFGLYGAAIIAIFPVIVSALVMTLVHTRRYVYIKTILTTLFTVSLSSLIFAYAIDILTRTMGLSMSSRVVLAPAVYACSVLLYDRYLGDRRIIKSLAT